MNSDILPYLAGFFDGEGTIIFRKRTRKIKKDYISVEIQITNTVMEPLILFNSVVKGKIVSQKNGAGHKLLYRVRYYAQNQILELLTLLYPFLRQKKYQAELTMAFCNSRKANPKNKYSTDEMDIYNTMKKLNKRGI